MDWACHHGVKYDKAVACLVKDRDALLAFYDVRAEHWKDWAVIRRPVRSGWSRSSPVSRTATRMPRPVKRDPGTFVACKPHVSSVSEKAGAASAATSPASVPVSLS